MFFIAVLFFFLVYIALFLSVVSFAAKQARKRGIKGWKWGLPAGLFMYLIVFWDHIPTLILHQHYCDTRAGFWVYKTAEQWKVENPGVAETLTWRESSPDYKDSDGAFGYVLNERFKYETRREFVKPFPLTIYTDSIIDTRNGAVMVKQISAGSGYGSMAIGGEGSWKFWVGSKACLSNEHELSLHRQSFKKLGRAAK